MRIYARIYAYVRQYVRGAHSLTRMYDNFDIRLGNHNGRQQTSRATTYQVRVTDANLGVYTRVTTRVHHERVRKLREHLRIYTCNYMYIREYLREPRAVTRIYARTHAQVRVYTRTYVPTTRLLGYGSRRPDHIRVYMRVYT